MSSSSNGIADPKQLIDFLLSDLRLLSTEAKKKHNNVKEAAENCLVKVRNISSVSSVDNLVGNLKNSSNDILQPILFACSSKNSRLAQIALQSLQRMLQYRIVNASSAPSIVNELCNLIESECEEIRVLQTITPFVSTELLVTGPSLAKCICLALRLNFHKDAAVINAASAVIRQLFSCVFERVIQEDGVKSGDLSVLSTHYNRTSKNVPLSLRPCAADGYLLLKDLCHLLNNEKVEWLVGIKDMTLTLGLELLEMILKNYPSIFFKHIEYVDLIKSKVVPLILKGFSSNYTSKSLNISNIYSPTTLSLQSSVSAQFTNSMAKHLFPNIVRLMRIVNVLITYYYSLLHTECNIFISVLIKYLQSDKLWQSGIALEVLHRILSQPDILKCAATSIEQKETNKVIRAISNSLCSFAFSVFMNPDFASNYNEDEIHDNSTSLGQSGFIIKGCGIALHENISTKRSILLDSLDKHDCVPLPYGYIHSLLYFCVFDFVQSLYAAFEDDKAVNNVPSDVLSNTLFRSSYKPILEIVILLLECSVDDSITEAMLNNLSVLIIAACKLKCDDTKHELIKSLCRVSLPLKYFDLFVDIPGGNQSNDNEVTENDFEMVTDKSLTTQVMAVGSVCPFPNMPSFVSNYQVMLTSKNILATKTLLSVGRDNGKDFLESWYIFLKSVQHLVWILGMKPIPNGHFKTSADSGEALQSNSSPSTTNLSSNPVLTTAVLNEIRTISDILCKMFNETQNFDDVQLLHIISALISLSGESMTVSQNGSKDSSYFPVAKLLQTALVNVNRLEIYWKLVTGHLNDVVTHPQAILREWGTISITMLVTSSLKIHLKSENKSRIESLILIPLTNLSKSDYVSVRKRQIDCLIQILHSNGDDFTSQIWPTLLNIPWCIVEGDHKMSDHNIIKDGYSMISLLVKDHIQKLPYECMVTLIKILSKFGEQKHELNISLASLEQLWTIADFMNIKYTHLSINEKKQFWLVLFDGIISLAIDSRPPIRKSACQTIIHTMSSNNFQLDLETWQHLLTKVVLPLINSIEEKTSQATKVAEKTAGVENDPNILIHHSRNTEYKQWAETTVQMLHGITKIIIAQRNTIEKINNFDKIWKDVLTAIRKACIIDNLEISMSGFKSFYELITAKGVPQNIDSVINNETSKILPDKLLIPCWDCAVEMMKEIGELNDITEKTVVTYIIGHKQLTIFIQILIILFEHLTKYLKPDIFIKNLFFERFVQITTLPITVDQLPFVVPAYNCELPAMQQAALNFITIFGRECINYQSSLRLIMPEALEVLLTYASFSCDPPKVPLGSNDKPLVKGIAIPQMTKFAEAALKISIDFYIHSIDNPEVTKKLVINDILKTLKRPLELKYNCPSQNTWQMAVQYLFNVIKVTLPLAYKNPDHFKDFWILMPSCIENFLFTTSKSTSPLTVDERKRHEYIDCQFIEFIRIEILTYTDHLPQSFLEKIIAILNRGTISSVEASDLFALDTCLQRADLSKVCFDALLSTCNIKSPSKNTPSHVLKRSEFGLNAVTSLMKKCKEILQEYARDNRRNGRLPMQRMRHIELLSVLQAMTSLIHGLIEKSNNVPKELLQNVANMFPSIIEMVPSLRGDQQIEVAVMSVFNAYNTFMLFLIQCIPNTEIST
uniref:Protein MON2 homolog (inferred by orthology to a human protein) n=1 Tax=Strongyloides venezuelensis TaxID=75913 RepID=A0A0K0G4R8_STRVS